MRKVSVGLCYLMLTFAPVALTARALPATGDELYTSLKRFTDEVEGHPPDSTTAQELSATVWSYAFIQGMGDGLLFGALSAHKDASCLNQPSDLALARITMKYIEEHPQSRAQKTEAVVYEALVQAYPCVR